MEALQLRVDGMSCGHCEETVSKAISGLAGVGAVRADHAAGTVGIDTTGAVDMAAVKRAIEEAGYSVVAVA